MWLICVVVCQFNIQCNCVLFSSRPIIYQEYKQYFFTQLPILISTKCTRYSSVDTQTPPILPFWMALMESLEVRLGTKWRLSPLFSWNQLHEESFRICKKCFCFFFAQAPTGISTVLLTWPTTETAGSTLSETTPLWSTSTATIYGHPCKTFLVQIRTSCLR